MLLHWLRTTNDLHGGISAGDAGFTILGGFWFILGFLIVFRSQQAYSRWWEGGSLLQKLRGEWFNAFSNTIAFLDNAPEKKQTALHFEHTLVRLFSLLYGTAIMHISEAGDRAFQFMDLDGMDVHSLEYMKSATDRSEIVLQWIQRLVFEAHEAKIITAAPPLVARVFNQLGRGIVVLNDAKKINALPIPFPLAQMILIMLAMHWLITAVLVAASVESMWWAGFIFFTVVFSFWSIHLIGEELEQPFGDDANDLPIKEMQREMNISLTEMLDVRARFPPAFDFDHDTHGILRTKTVDIVSHVEEMYEASLHLTESEGARTRAMTTSEDPVDDCGDCLPQQGFPGARQRVPASAKAPLAALSGEPSPAVLAAITAAAATAAEVSAGGGHAPRVGQARGGLDAMPPVLGEMPSTTSVRSGPPVLSQLPSIASEAHTQHPYGCMLTEDGESTIDGETYIDHAAFQQALDAHLAGSIAVPAQQLSGLSGMSPMASSARSWGLASPSARSGVPLPSALASSAAKARRDVPKLRLQPGTPP